METDNLPLICWHIGDYENEYVCSTIDEYYADRLFFAVESHDLTIVKTFTDAHLRNLCRICRLFSSEWSAPEQEKQTAYQRACFLGHTDIVQYMLNAGIKVDQEFWCGGTSCFQRSAFMFACHSGSITTIRALLQAVSSDYVEHYKCRNRKGYCSSSFAKQYLIPQSSWVEESSYTIKALEFVYPIHFAIAQDNLEMARLIVTASYGELDTQNSWESFLHGGFIPLHIACLFNRSIDMIKLLLALVEGCANPLLRTSSAGMYADQMTNDKTVIEYLRPKRLCIIEAMERERSKDLEQMLSGIPYQITIRPLSGQTLTLTVTGHTTTLELAECIQKEWGIPLHQQKLLIAGRSILNWGQEPQPLVHHNIKKDSIVNIMWRNPN